MVLKNCGSCTSQIGTKCDREVIIVIFIKIYHAEVGNLIYLFLICTLQGFPLSLFIPALQWYPKYLIRYFVNR